MNPLKTLFNKVFDSTPPGASPASKQNPAFEWNPDDEVIGPTSARTISWKRRDTPDDGPSRRPGEATDADVAASAHNLPAPTFEKNTPVSADLPPASARPLWNQPPVRPTPSSQTPPLLRTQGGALAPTQVPLSDFEDVYRKAGIKSPVHGYGVERVYRLLTSRRLVGLDRSVKRSALLTALDAAGVPPSDVSQDAVLRRKALTAFEAEKALELQSLRSRNESRAEALQDTVETFTRQKQGQIERLAQGSTSAVRAQSDLEIRKRMEQDRLFRSLAYFVEPLPSPASGPRVSFPETARVIAPPPMAEMAVPAPEPKEIRPSETLVEAVTVPAAQDSGADTRPRPQSSLETALRAAAEEARTKGWGRTTIVDDRAGDAVDALRKLREAKKPESES